MKVLFVSHSSVLKYHQQKLVILAKKFGVELYLVTPPYWFEGGAKVEPFKGNPEIKCVPGEAFVMRKKMFHFYMNPGKIVEQVNPDIIHIEEIPFNVACWQFVNEGRKRKKKIVFFTWENIRRKLNPVYNFFWNHNIKHADAIITGNEEGRYIINEKGFTREVHVLPQYGINIEDFAGEKELYPKAGEKFNVAFIGRLVPEKGIETLLEAAGGVKNININIIGAGDEEYIKRLQSLTVNRQLSTVNFAGRKDNSEIPVILKKTHIVVLPSETRPHWKEQFGRVLVEAFASRTAVIGSDSGEIPNVIKDAGIVFREKDEQGLRQALVKMTTDREFYLECIEKGYERAKLYTNEKLAERIYGIYTALLGR